MNARKAIKKKTARKARRKRKACKRQMHKETKARTLHKKWSSPLRISSVNVAKQQGTVDLVTFTEEILNGKLHFLCSGKAGEHVKHVGT